MKYPDGVIWCPQCRNEYGRIFRVQVNETVWTNQTEPEAVPKYCAICECPTERKP